MSAGLDFRRSLLVMEILQDEWYIVINQYVYHILHVCVISTFRVYRTLRTIIHKNEDSTATREVIN